jgi:hypothetical protein
MMLALGQPGSPGSALLSTPLSCKYVAPTEITLLRPGRVTLLSNLVENAYEAGKRGAASLLLLSFPAAATTNPVKFAIACLRL